MSMPIIKPSGVKRCEAVNDIIASVALQQNWFIPYFKC